MTLLNIGADFAGYRVLDILGSGGMGAVYLVENAQLHRCEALKVISVGGSNSAEFERRFVNEARAAAGLDHPASSPSTTTVSPRALRSSPWPSWLGRTFPLLC
ncbi:hypothetical protein [Gordonia sp. NPDC003422]